LHRRSTVGSCILSLVIIWSCHRSHSPQRHHEFFHPSHNTLVRVCRSRGPILRNGYCWWSATVPISDVNCGITAFGSVPLFTAPLLLLLRDGVQYLYFWCILSVPSGLSESCSHLSDSDHLLINLSTTGLYRTRMEITAVKHDLKTFKEGLTVSFHLLYATFMTEVAVGENRPNSQCCGKYPEQSAERHQRCTH
jgi:hypothetical protein